MARETLPQQRARETRGPILAAARVVFGRRGYGQATIEDISAEAAVSNGALYHHFASKEELFKAILEDHISDQHFEISALVPASSLHELLERFARYWFEHLRDAHSDDPLFAEIWAQAVRDPWARQSMIAFIRDGAALIENALRIGQEAGLVRREIDAAAAATLIYATMEGLFLLWTIDSDGVDPTRLTQPWVESMERLLASDDEPDLDKFKSDLEGFLDVPTTNGPPDERPR